MNNKREIICDTIKVIERRDYKYGVEDLSGSIIVPYGKYGWIDKFRNGYARVKTMIGHCWTDLDDDFNMTKHNYPKWGIINQFGEEVVPLEYDEIWRLKDGYNRMVMYKKTIEETVHDENIEVPTVYGGRPKKGSVFFDVTDGQIYTDPKTPCYSRNACHDDYGTHYGEYAGSYAQDVMGYSDDVIGDAFEGNPDVYWNID